MPERATEIGGECIIENNPTGSTIVKARLPADIPLYSRDPSTAPKE